MKALKEIIEKPELFLDEDYMMNIFDDLRQVSYFHLLFFVFIAASANMYHIPATGIDRV